jgi:uncharacterized protein (DUF2384 family)
MTERMTDTERLAEIRARMAGRTQYEGRPEGTDEFLLRQIDEAIVARDLALLDVGRCLGFVLGDFYQPEQIEEWMGTPNVTLGGKTPMELVQGGELKRVLQLLAQLRDGAFT